MSIKQLKKWMKNISFSLAGKIISMILWLGFDIVAARRLNVKDYAEWVFFYSILTMCFYFGWIGINVSSKVHISHCDIKERKGLIRISFETRIIASVVILIVMMVLVPRAAEVLGHPNKYTNLRILLYFLPVIVFFNSLLDYSKEVFMGLESFKKVFVITVSEYLGFFVISVLLLIFNKNSISLAEGYLVGEFLAAAVGCYFVINSASKAVKNAIEISTVKSILKYSIPIALLSFGGMILMEMDTFMLGVFSTPINISNYSIAKSICAKAAHVNYAMTVGVMTTFAVIEDNYDEKRIAFGSASRMNICVAILLAICMYIFGTVAVYILYGEKYPEAGGIIRILVVYYILFSISNFYSSFLDFRNKAGIRSILYLSVIVLNIVLNYILIPKYGAKGAAIATDISLLPYTIMVIAQTTLEWRKAEKIERVKVYERTI